MCVSSFSTAFFPKSFFILRRIKRAMIESVCRSSPAVPLLLSDFNETRILSTVFRKILSIKYRENPSSGSQVVPCGYTDGRTDRHDEANSRFSQFCERA